MKKYLLLLRLFVYLLLLTFAACSKSSAPPPVPVPTIAAISPLSGAAGTTVTITGTNFDPAVANNTVKFNGTAAAVTSATASQLVVTAPSGGTTGSVTVTTTGGTVAGATFTFQVAALPPTVTAIAPVGGAAGITVTITGTQFSTTVANNTVKFNGVVATVQTATATTLTVQAPATGTTGAVTVTNSGGTATGQVFTYLAAHDVCILGSTAAGFCYWKNGVRTDLPANANQINSLATSIYVSGTDVYVGGAIGVPGGNSPAYWKNGASVSLPFYGNNGEVNGITVSGSDVYAAGTYYASNDDKYPKCWKNGVDYPLTASQGLSAGFAAGIVLANGDLYVSGNQNNGFDATFIATYWKNGNPVKLTSTGTSGVAGIFISGTDVYCAGSNSGVPSYWKNGTVIALAAPSSSSSVAIGRILYVLGSDVYVVGQGNGSAKYWKNGALIGLTSKEFDSSIATCIHGAGNDVYIGGESDGVNHVWGYWENGIFTTIPDCTHVYDIIVQ